MINNWPHCLTIEKCLTWNFAIVLIWFVDRIIMTVLSRDSTEAVMQFTRCLTVGRVGWWWSVVIMENQEGRVSDSLLHYPVTAVS